MNMILSDNATHSFWDLGASKSALLVRRLQDEAPSLIDSLGESIIYDCDWLWWTASDIRGASVGAACSGDNFICGFANLSLVDVESWTDVNLGASFIGRLPKNN